MLRQVTRTFQLFSTISVEVYPQLKTTLEQTRSLQTLGDYFCLDNAETLIKLIRSSRLSLYEENVAYKRLLDLCKTEDDREIELASTILEEQGRNYVLLDDHSTS